MLLNYFKSIFSNDHHLPIDWPTTSTHILSHLHIQQLLLPLTDAKIDLAISSISAWKALGLDGFPEGSITHIGT